MIRQRRPLPAPEIRVSGHTLVEIVDMYLRELANTKAPDYVLRQIYREWMRESVDAHSAADDEASR